MERTQEEYEQYKSIEALLNVLYGILPNGKEIVWETSFDHENIWPMIERFNEQS